MIEMFVYDEKYVLDLSKLSSKQLFSYFFILNKLKSQRFIPNFSFNESKCQLCIEEPCKICKTISKNDIDRILTKLDKYGILLNKLEKIPFMIDEHKNIFFFNFFYSTCPHLLKIFKIKVSNLSNKYIVKKFVEKYYSKYSNQKKISIFIKNYDSMEQLTKQVNDMSIYKLDITYIMLVKENQYEEMVDYFNKDKVNKFILIKVENTIKEFYMRFIIEVANVNADIIYFSDNFNDINKKLDIFNKAEANCLFYKSKRLSKQSIYKVKKNNNKLFKTIRGSEKDFFKYNKDDIDPATIKVNNFFINKNVIEKYEDVIYDFIDKKYPKLISFNGMVIDNKAIKILANKFRDTYDIIASLNFYEIKILFIMSIFYSEIKPHYL